MADWGQTFDIGEVLRMKMLMEQQDMRDRYLAEAQRRETAKANRELEQDKQERLQKQFVIKRLMSQDMVKRARLSGIDGDALAAKVGELMPAYGNVYKQAFGDDLMSMSPDDVIALGGVDDAALEARKQAMIDQAEYGVKHLYGDTPIDKAQLNSIEAMRGNLPQGYRFAQNGMAEPIPGLRTPEQELHDKLQLEREQSKLRMAEKGAPTYADLNPQARPLTEGQADALNYATRMGEALKVINEIEKPSFDPSGNPVENQGAWYTPSRGQNIRRSLGGINEAFGGGRYGLMDEASQRFHSAQDAYILSLLRTDTGASYRNMEQDDIKSIFFPQEGDELSVKAQKKALRDATMEAVMSASGSAANDLKGRYGIGGRKPLPPGFTILPDGRVMSPWGVPFRFAQ